MPRTLYGVTIFAGLESIWALTFAEVDITDFITALGFLLTAVFAGVTGMMAQRRRREMEEIKATVTDVKETTKVIEGHANSARTKSEEIITAQTMQLEMLRATIATQEKQAALLAQARASSEALAAVAIATNTGTVARPESDSGMAVNIKETAENTAGIKDNTAKTKADVEVLKDNL